MQVQRNLCQTVAKGLGSQTTMQKSQRRLKMVYGHIMNNSTRFCNVSADKPTITLQPTTCLVDEQIHISVSGLIADQVVTLTSHVEEGGSKFEARAVYKASKSGTVDNKWDPSLAGTYTGKILFNVSVTKAAVLTLILIIYLNKGRISFAIVGNKIDE